MTRMHGHPFARGLLLGSVQVALLAGCGLGSRGGGGEMEGADLPFDPTADSRATSDDPTPHDRRHDRLVEYTRIILDLVAGETVTVEGEFYRVSKLKLTPALPEDLRPEIFVSGSSKAELEAGRLLGARPVAYPRPPGEQEAAQDPYWLVPFENYSSMCPYLVGSREEVGTTLGRYLELGSRTFPLDVPREATDLANARLPFAEAMEEAPA